MGGFAALGTKGLGPIVTAENDRRSAGLEEEGIFEELLALGRTETI